MSVRKHEENKSSVQTAHVLLGKENNVEINDQYENVL